MTTKTIGIKEYRQNITSIWKEARKKNIRYIVMVHAKPVFELNPLHDEDTLVDILRKDIEEARQQIERGETVPHEALMKQFGIK